MPFHASSSFPFDSPLLEGWGFQNPLVIRDDWLQVLGSRFRGSGFRGGLPTVIENQMEKKLKNEMEMGITPWIFPQGLRFGHQVQGLGFSFKCLLSNKQELPLCPFHLVFVPMPSGLGQVYRGFKPVFALTRRIYSQKNRFPGRGSDLESFLFANNYLLLMEEISPLTWKVHGT